MAELEQIVKRYFRLEEDKQRLEREMAGFEKPAVRYFGLERDKQRLEREMAGLERSARRYVELRSSDLHGLRQGKSSRDGADNSLLAKLPDEPQKRG